jgi:hypothetical protein
MSVLTHFPKSRLSELAGRFGGLSREEAVEAATRELEILRPEAIRNIEAAIAGLEKIVSDAIPRRDGSAAMMKTLLPAADQIVTLAGTYGYTALDKAARSLCDLLDGLLRQEKTDLASIRVHVQTIRMLAPGATALAAEHVEVMLFELARLLDHHAITPHTGPLDSEDASIGAAP